jgi:hypothetical protein
MSALPIVSEIQAELQLATKELRKEIEVLLNTILALSPNIQTLLR